jgi:hypothetical protein
MKIRRKSLIVYVYYQPNSCTMYHTPAEHWWAGETFLRQQKKSSSSPRAAGVYITGIAKRAEELLLKHEDDELVLIVLLFRLRISTFIEFSPLRELILIPAKGWKWTDVDKFCPHAAWVTLNVWTLTLNLWTLTLNLRTLDVDFEPFHVGIIR